MSAYISTFNPLRMEEQEILALATGREHPLEQILSEMERCLKPQTNHHFLLHGPRGIGKSFFTKYLKIKCEKLEQFKNSLFIQLPEEQSNVQFVSDIIEMLCVVIEHQPFQKVQAKWEVDDAAWRSSVKKLKQLIKEQKTGKPDFHIFFSMENLQDFIPQLDEIENGRLREFLEQFKDISLIGTSVRPDLDNDYNERLFQVFKKYPINPWTLEDCLTYYDKRVAYLKEKGETPLKDVALNRQKVKAISVFTGGSPRIAVILNRLVLEENIESVADTLRGIIDELTPYYQDLTKAMPPKTKLLFDTLIRNGENMTQSKLAELLGKQQNVISKPFRWLKENFYVIAVKQKQGNVRHYSVRDRMYSLYWQQRQILSEEESTIGLLAGFLFQFFGEKEMFEKTKKAWAKKSPIAVDLLKFYIKDIDFIYQTSDEGKANYVLEREEQRLKDIGFCKERINKFENQSIIDYSLLGNAYLNHAILLFVGRNENPEMLSCLNKAISYLEKSLEIEESEPALLDLAYSNLYAGKIDESIKYFTRIVDVNTEKLIELMEASRFLFFNNWFKEAQNFYEVALSIEPKNYESLIHFALLQFILHNNEKGFEYLGKAFEINQAIKTEYNQRNHHPNIFRASIAKLLDNSVSRSRHELFEIMMAVIHFFRKENIWSCSYYKLLQTVLQRLYIYNKKDLMLDIISEERSSFKKESFMHRLLTSMEQTLSTPDLLKKIDEMENPFVEFQPDIRSYLLSFIENVKYGKEWLKSGKKIWL